MNEATPEGKPEPITAEAVFRRLRTLADDDTDGLQHLAADIAAHCHAPARTVLDTWLKGAPDREIPCAHITSELKELSAGDLLQRAPAISPARRVQFLELASNQAIVFRELMLTALAPLLEDPSPARGQLRTSDLAYLLIRRLVTPVPAEAPGFSSEKQFVSLDPHAREREVARWTQSATWQAIFPA